MAGLLCRCPAGRLHHALWISLPLADVSRFQLGPTAASNRRTAAHEPLYRVQPGSHPALPLGNVVALWGEDRNRSGRDDRWASSPCSPACARSSNFRLGAAVLGCSSIAAAVHFPSTVGGCIPLVRWA